MAKFNFNQPIEGLDGKPLVDANQLPVMAGKVLGNVLAQQTKGDAIKLFSWARKMYDGEELDLDLSDIEVLKAIVNDDATMFAMTKATIMTILLKG